MAKTYTPEEIEQQRANVAAADAAAAAERKAAAMAVLQPFLDAGWGSSSETSPIRTAIKVAQDAAHTLQAIDPTTANLMFSMAMPMATADDKIRSLAEMNAPAAVDPV